jgi:hypothetical protein
VSQQNEILAENLGRVAVARLAQPDPGPDLVEPVAEAARQGLEGGQAPAVAAQQYGSGFLDLLLQLRGVRVLQGGVGSEHRAGEAHSDGRVAWPPKACRILASSFAA